LADALSQEEIDSMLSRALRGEPAVEEKKADKEVGHTKYDFRAPKKFTKERMKTLDSIFESYGRLLSSYLTGLLRLYCNVKMTSIEELKYYEYNNALPDYVMMGMGELLLNGEEMEAMPIILQFQNNLTFLMIDRLLGGKGGLGKETDRDFTEIETNIMLNIMSRMIKMMKDPWAVYVDVQAILNGIETNARIISNVSYDETMIVCAFEVQIGEEKTLITVLCPALELEEIMKKFVNRNRSSHSAKKYSEEREKERKSTIFEGVSNTIVPVTAVLDEVTLDMYDLINLQINDVIPLSKQITANITIKIGGTVWFDGKIGIVNDKKAIRIENVISPESERKKGEFKLNSAGVV
jgi:flagellar motor switch protein FliM